MNDILLWIIIWAYLIMFAICFNEILEWMNIPFDSESKHKYYDEPTTKRGTKIIIAITTPLFMILGFRILASSLGLGFFNAFILWCYILTVYHYKYTSYYKEEHYPFLRLFYISIMILTCLTWNANTPFTQIYQCIWQGAILFFIRSILVYIISASKRSIDQTISFSQHLLWDPLTSQLSGYSLYLKICDRLECYIRDIV